MKSRAWTVAALAVLMPLLALLAWTFGRMPYPINKPSPSSRTSPASRRSNF
jgi:hypothetical protein